MHRPIIVGGSPLHGDALFLHAARAVFVQASLACTFFFARITQTGAPA